MSNISFEYDTTLEIAKHHGITTTPQVILFDSLSNIIYTGQVDNYYYSFGKHRSSASKNYLENAIVATLSGDIPEIKMTKPIGCRINFH